MTEDQVRAFFEGYLASLAAWVRGEQDHREELLELYHVPAVLTTDDSVLPLTSGDDVVATFGAQLEALRAAGLARSVPLEEEVQILNGTTARYTALLSRQRADGTEIMRLEVTYVVVAVGDGLRVAVVVLHA